MANKSFVGLTSEQVEENRKKYGANILTPPPREPLWKLFLEKFKDPIIRILLIAAFLSLGISIVHNEYAETIGIFFAIFLATAVAFWFERDANKKFDVLNTVNDDIKIKVIRDANVCEISKKDVVVEDIVLLETGEEVPADGELLDAVSLQIDESCLTGEPMISKTIIPQDFKYDVTYPSNWVMRGTKVMDGHATFQVKNVGDNTEYGKVAKKSTEMSGEETPLNLQLEGLAKFIGVIGLIIAALTFSMLFAKDMITTKIEYNFIQITSILVVILSAMIMLSKVWMPIIFDGIELLGKQFAVNEKIKDSNWFIWIGIGILTFGVFAGISFLLGTNVFEKEAWVSFEMVGNILQYFMVAVTLIVVAVPEGLPMSVTLSLALSMRKMLVNNNLVRKMHACETMGAATVICTDKTGTLTQNQMQIHETLFFALNNQKFDSEQNSKLVYEGISVNTTAFLDFSDKTKVNTIGNPTEAALLLWLHKNNINYLKIREEATIIDQLTFSTERKFMATVVNSNLLNKKVLYVKGAPEIVMAKCNNVMTEKGMVETDKLKNEIFTKLEQYQNKAMRTLGFACAIIEDNNSPIVSGELKIDKLTFLGIVAISDPVRLDVPDAVKVCLTAGIDVKIVTGDTPGTAKEIGRQIGIWTADCNESNIISGTEFEKLSDEIALEKVRNIKIMCRARPTDKQRFVQLLQKNDQIVAVTGDGTNDAPALNYAHVGLSMGSGTSVAKEASDITLLDDSFASITTAVMWGRSLYQNIQRFILFQLTINVVALTIVFLGSILGHTLPLTVTQMLWVNLIMDTFAAGALASLPPDKKVMNRKPRKNNDFIITKKMRVGILGVGFSFVGILLALMYLFSNNGEISDYDLSRFFTIFVMLQFWNMFNAKAFDTQKSAFADMKNSIPFILVAFIIIVGQILIVTFGNEVFRTVQLTITDWLIIIFSTSTVLILGEIIRLVIRLQKKNN